MESITRRIPSRELRESLADVLGGVSYGSERVGVTRHGKLAAVVISVDDLELLEELEAARDAAEFRAAKADDDGGRITLDELRAEAS
jgi:prevent-host-death family protein